MEVQWPHNKEAGQQHHTGSQVGSARQEKEGGSLRPQSKLEENAHKMATACQDSQLWHTVVGTVYLRWNERNK